MKINFTFNRLAVVAIILLLVADLLYTSTSPAYKEYKSMIKKVEEANKDFRFRLLGEIMPSLSNLVSQIEKSQNYEKSLFSSSQNITILNNNNSNLQSEQVEISDYSYCENGSYRCGIIGGYTYYEGDDYQDDIIIHFRPWGFLGKKRIYCKQKISSIKQDKIIKAEENVNK